MKFVIKILYSIYIISFLDTILVNPVLKIHSYYSIAYALISVFLFAYLERGRMRKYDIFILIPIASFSLLIFLTFFSSMTNGVIWGKMLCLLTMLISNYFIFRHYDLYNEILNLSTIIPSFFILWRFIMSGASFEVYSKLDMLFGSAPYARYRVAFGTFHPNTIGNLACCVVNLSLVMLSTIKRNHLLGKIRFFLILLLSFIDFTVLLSTDSRSSILATFICLLVFFFFKTTDVKNIRLRFCLKLLLTLLGAFIFAVQFGNKIIALFFSSQRYDNFAMNLPNLNSPVKVLFGLGLIDAGDFGKGTTGLRQTFFVDNYYLYVLLTMGLVGIVIIIYMIVKYFKLFLSAIRKWSDSTSILMLAVFCGHIFTAFGETCFLYFSFPSAALYFSTYLAYFSRQCLLNKRKKNC